MTFTFDVPPGCADDELLVAAYNAEVNGILPDGLIESTDPSVGFVGGAYSGPGGSTVSFSFNVPPAVSIFAGSGFYQLVIFKTSPGRFNGGCAGLKNFHQVHDGTFCYSFEANQIGGSLSRPPSCYEVVMSYGSFATEGITAAGTIVAGPTSCTAPTVNSLAPEDIVNHDLRYNYKILNPTLVPGNRLRGAQPGGTCVTFILYFDRLSNSENGPCPP